ncbi:MAG: hypothetical protein IPL43_11235 [Micropruina sp.]|nr:hypothetical protein [Micropruina sp.]
MRFVRVTDHAQIADSGLRSDAWGGVGVMLRGERYGELDALVDTYLVGDARESYSAECLLLGKERV